MKPFLKWVGGKGRVIAQLEQYFPESFNSYFEPFVGGGAVFFHLNAKQATINDVNKSLMGTYINIRDSVEPLIKKLTNLQKRFHKLDDEKQREMFYEIRNKYNSIKDKQSLNKSVLLIFLNKTCFNGMYRENKSGGFNIPFGKYSNPTICDAENLRAVSQRIAHTKILSEGYEEAVTKARSGDFVYLDPPYYPLNSTSRFTSYSEGDFVEKDQIELKELFDKLAARGCKVMMSNSYTKFIINLYKDRKQYKIYVGRSINSKATGRGKIAEIVVTNY